MGRDGDRSGEVWAVAIFFTILCWIALGLRVWVRAGIIRNFGLDDGLMVVTMCFFQAYLSCQIGGVIYGTGRHHWDNTPENVEKALRFWWFCELFYILATIMLKISVGVFLLRIATKKWHTLFIRLLMAGCAVFGVAYFFNALFECKPFHLYWTQSPGAKGCARSDLVVRSMVAASVINAVADWVFGILPIFMVWPLKVATKAKLLIAMILALAAIGSTATVIRIPYLHTLADTDDYLWSTTDVAIWSTVEPGIGIAAGSIATLRPLLQMIMYKAGLSTTDPSSPSKNLRASNKSRSGQSHARSTFSDPSKSTMGVTTTISANCATINSRQETSLSQRSEAIRFSRFDRMIAEEAQVGFDFDLDELDKTGNVVVTECECSRSCSGSFRPGTH